MNDSNGTIGHVSDTALWVAHYRAEETERPDALFRDPFAKILVGDRGRKIAKKMSSSSKFTAWSLPIRTIVIDRYIQNLIKEGVDGVLNLGAGLDTRPWWIFIFVPFMKADAIEKIRHMMGYVLFVKN